MHLFGETEFVEKQGRKKLILLPEVSYLKSIFRFSTALLMPDYSLTNSNFFVNA